MSLDDHIRELCIRVEISHDPDELCEVTGLLRAALHAKIAELSNGVADVIRNTPYGSLLEITDARVTSGERKPPASDYSAA